jgi:8-oxo-dGTP diphosphatase
MKTLQISVGIIRNSQGRFLSPSGPPMRIWRTSLNSRAVKLKRRVVRTGLVRELQEEVGITAKAYSLFDKLEYQFPDRHITLWFWLVNSWEGEPWGKKGSRAAGLRRARSLLRIFRRQMNPSLRS